MESLDLWIERQYRHAVAAMLPSISAVGIVKQRPGFGQTVVPKKGSIVASPVLAAYDPDPDYFFHWYRDSAVIIDALRLLVEADDVVGAREDHALHAPISQLTQRRPNSVLKPPQAAQNRGVLLEAQAPPVALSVIRHRVRKRSNTAIEDLDVARVDHVVQ